MRPSDRTPIRRSSSSLGWLTFGAFLLAACGETAVPIQGFAHPTLMEVSPEDFLGNVPCLAAPGAMRRYVATVYDVTATLGSGGQSNGGASGDDSEAQEFALPSSTLDRGDGRITPVPCTQNVGFSHIVHGNKYRAEIDGYDRDDLVALAPGLRIVVDPVTFERVPPRWTTDCGKKVPVSGRRFVVRRIAGCDPLEDSAEPGETLLEVRIDDALGPYECGSGSGAVDRFEVTPPGGAPVAAACGEAVTLRDLTPSGATLTLPVRAFEAGATEPTWGTTCLAEVIQGVTTTATCLPLSSTGVLAVDPLDALAALGLECDSAAFAELEVEVVGATPRYVPPSGCGRPLRFEGHEPGPATASVTARFSNGTRSARALCSATIVPGETALAACVREP